MLDSIANGVAPSVAYRPMESRKEKSNWVYAAVANIGGTESDIENLRKVAELWPCHIQTVRNWVERGDIANFTVEDAVRFATVSGIDIGHLTRIPALKLLREGQHVVERKMRRKGRRSKQDEADETTQDSKPEAIRTSHGARPKDGEKLD